MTSTLVRSVFFHRFLLSDIHPRIFANLFTCCTQLVGIYEALNSGVTSILEHAHATFSNDTSAAYLNASIDSAVRMWWCYAFHELSNGFTIEDQIANFRDLRREERLGASLVEMGMAYDGFASAPPDEIQAVIDLAKCAITLS